MACNLEVVQFDACTSGIGKVEAEIQLLQIIAQLQAELLQVASPGTEITPAAILARACTSGIGKVLSPVTLQQIIAQLLCDGE